MTVWAYNTTIVQTGTIHTISSNDILYVGRDAFLVTASTATPAVPTFLIYGGSYFVTLNIDGYVAAGTTAIMTEPLGARDLDITVGTTGKITGTTAIELGGGGGDYNILNRGEISGSDYGIILGGSGSTSIINYGLIYGSSNTTGTGAVHVPSNASGTVRIDNYGQIGRQADGDAIDTESDGVRWNIINRGQIFGDLFLGNANDIVRNKGEILVADILNVYFRAGNDLFDGRGGSVIGDTTYSAINMGADDDRYIAGDAEETVDGGTGAGDILDFRHTAGIIVSLDGTLDATGAAYGDTYVNFETVWGSTTGSDTIRGDGNANLLVGNGGADILEGMAGNDTIRGGRGSDLLDGGDGNDIADYSDKTLAVTVSMDGSGTFDVIVGGALEENVKNFEGVAGGSGNDILKGNSGANTLYGNQGNDSLDAGADSLADTLIGGGGSDTYIVRSLNDIVVELAGGGVDRVRATVNYVLAAGVEVEFIDSASATVVSLTGNTLSQTITGNAGANTLNGGGGADTLSGLDGDDTYLVDSLDDVVVETASGGSDTVKAAATYSLGSSAYVEFLRTANDAGISGISLTGNDSAQSIVGNAGNNTLSGKLGNDTLTGGAGQDIFGFESTPNASTNFDTISDFSVADDVIALRAAVFTGIGPAFTSLDPARFKNVTTGGPVDSDDRILYDDDTGVISYDSDGSGVAAAIAFAVLTASPTITAADFFLA